VTKARLLVGHYRAARPLHEAELTALPLLARGSALRFLLTRLYDWLNQTEGALVRPKDPIEYLKKLRFHRGIAGPAAYGIDP
jgi:homoserine kinase type II